VNRARSISKSGHAIVERLGNTGLERLGDIGRHFLSERREFLGLRRHRLEMFARMRGRQFKKLRHRLHAQHGIGVVEGGVGIGTRNFDELEIVVRGALGGGRIAILEEIPSVVRVFVSVMTLDPLRGGSVCDIRTGRPRHR
jgi:hypothetical protein